MISMFNIKDSSKPPFDIAKLKAIEGESNTFGLYNLGVNHNKNKREGSFLSDEARREYGVFVFWYQKNLANDSKMSNLMRNITAVLPAIE